MRVITYTHPTADHAAARVMLVGLGFTFEKSSHIERTVLDTLDRRLLAAKMRAERRTAGSVELVVVQSGSLPARQLVPAPVRLVAELPQGPLRDRLASVVEQRVLLDEVTIVETMTAAVVGRAGRAPAVAAVVHEDVVVAGRPTVVIPTTIDLTVPGERSARVASVADALERLGFRMCDEAIEQARAATTGDRRVAPSSPAPEMAGSCTALAAFRAVFGNLDAAIEANWQATIEHVDDEALHDLRVAVRRTRSVLAAAKGVVAVPVRHRLGDELAWLAAATSRPRDLDVLVARWPAPTTVAGHEQLAFALVALRGDREQAYAELATVLQSTRATRLRELWRAWLNEPSDAADGARRADDPIGAVVADRIAEAHSRLIADGRTIAPTSPNDALHALRKDAKKLRYVIECFASALPAKPRKHFVNELKLLQDLLGEHQDAEVHLAELRAIAARTESAAAGHSALEDVIANVEQLSHSTRAGFAHRFARFDSKHTRRQLAALTEAR